jgi:hypothetical protein
MPLYPLHSSGIRAYCTDLIVDALTQETAYFLSLCGYQVTVKGLVANFLEYTSLCLEKDDCHYYFERSYQNYSFQLKRLPSGLVHGLVYPKQALPKSEEYKNQFFIFTKEQRNIVSLFFRHLDNITEIPLHPSWDSWLWNTFKTNDWLVELTTLAGTSQGYLLSFNPTQLNDFLSDAIKNKVPEIIMCMERKL